MSARGLRARQNRNSPTLSLFNQGNVSISGVSNQRFPLNADGQFVENAILPDLRESTNPLIISGYFSLDRFLDFASGAHSGQRIRFLVGNEPTSSRRTEFLLDGDDLPEEADRYWLARGISLVRSAALIRTIELLKSGVVEARHLSKRPMLHAKIYCGDRAATVGSSNFTEPGLAKQHEANARFEKDSKEGDRYDELVKIAEGFWASGRAYNWRLTHLLERLLKPVEWDEALARACAELLEGEWAEVYLRKDIFGGSGPLWPSQRQGIAQALQILDQQGSVLIADATGAGKTRMCVHLVGAVHDLIVRSGRFWHGKALMIAPPSVVENWRTEVRRSSINLNVRSHGELSNSSSRGHDNRIEELTTSQLLCVDEGHNFLNLGSQRTQLVLRNLADHVVMLTATPINKGVTDLLRIADILGADNLQDSTLAAFKTMLARKRINRTLIEPELKILRAELRKFTVRRTKSVLNALIDREPNLYRDSSDRKCRFPRHDPKVYELHESDADRNIAKQISGIAHQLLGVTHFVAPIEMPTVMRKQGLTDAEYLKGRLRSAKTLARYLVMRALRSSRAALIEHIEGTVEALAMFKLSEDFSKQETGNQCDKLSQLSGRLPINKLRVSLPQWLSDATAHVAACSEEIERYKSIAFLAKNLSENREQRKADLLHNLLLRHRLVLAFDSRPISLAVIRQKLQALNTRVLLAWGESYAEREELLRTFGKDSEEKTVVGLCSDSLSEGVNLQGASAIVHLDMPSVVRIAEQRVGRVDRMDSPYESIEAWWPNDAEEFSLTSDDRFVERFETVEQLLGSNVPLPHHLQSNKVQPTEKITAEKMIEEMETEAAEPWDGIEDAYGPVRRLVEGPQSIVAPEIYERYRTVKDQVLSRVSLVASQKPWAFFCLSAGGFGSPRWIFLPSLEGEIQGDLNVVASAIRQRLGPDTVNLQFNDKAAKVLNAFLERLPSAERSFLSKKKARAIEQLIAQAKKLSARPDVRAVPADAAMIVHLIEILTGSKKVHFPDWDEIASRWLDLIRPVWFERLNEPRQKPLLLKDISKDLESRPDWLLGEIKKHFATIPVPKNIDERVRACIIGIDA
jgi:superfamily II DNA or RNA helicase